MRNLLISVRAVGGPGSGPRANLICALLEAQSLFEGVRDAKQDGRDLAVAPEDDGQIVVRSVPAETHEKEHRGDGVVRLCGNQDFTARSC